MRNWRCWFGHAMFDARGFPAADWYVLVQPRTVTCRRCGERRTLYPHGQEPWNRRNP